MANPGRDDVAYEHIDKVTLRTFGGNDLIQVDDNAVETLIEMGFGDDLINVATVSTFVDEFGVEVVDREPLVAGVNGHNRGYMTAKVDRLGHLVGHQELL